MINISQELGLVLFVGGIVGFFMFVIISSKMKKDTKTEDSSNSK
jgi:preprotein translocase subunit YajC